MKKKTTKRCMKIKFGQLGNTVNGMYGRGKQQGCIGVGVSLIPTFKSQFKKKAALVPFSGDCCRYA